MITVYKIVSEDMTSYGGYKWVTGRARKIKKSLRSKALCSSGVLHAYRGVEQALLLDRAHGNYGDSGLLFAAKTPEIVVDDGAKLGVHELTLVERAERPAWWLDEKTRLRAQVQFAVLCAKAVLGIFEAAYPGDDRPRRAIEAAEMYLSGAAGAAAAAAAYAAAADYAARAAAARAAYAAAAAGAAARAAAYAAAGSAYAAAAAGDAARAAAARSAVYLETSVLAKQAVDIVLRGGEDVAAYD